MWRVISIDYKIGDHIKWGFPYGGIGTWKITLQYEDGATFFPETRWWSSKKDLYYQVKPFTVTEDSNVDLMETEYIVVAKRFILGRYG